MDETRIAKSKSQAGGSNTKEELQRLMDKATNETEKEAIRVAIESMNN